MRRGGRPLELPVRAFNTGVSALLENPWTGPWIGKGITVVSYAGRRSGRTFSTPVACQRDGDQVTIRVDLPDAKNWWRNFTGDGGQVALRLDGGDRPGHAVARRTGVVWATVTVRLDPPTAGRPRALTSPGSTCHRRRSPIFCCPGTAVYAPIVVAVDPARRGAKTGAGCDEDAKTAPDVVGLGPLRRIG